MEFFLHSFGCRASQADGAAIERQLAEKGLIRAVRATEAKLVVLNTCTVTAAADQDARAAIRRVHRENPSCQIVVTGCYAQRAPEEIAALPGVSRVIGNSHKHALAEIALGKVGQRSTGEDARSYIETPIMGQRSTGGNARSYIDAPIMGQRSTGGDARSYIDTPIMGQRSTGGDAR